MQDWQTAITLYTQSRSIYEKLSGAFMDESLKVLYLQRVEEIGPNIRYCAYNLGQGGMDINDLMKMRSSAAGQVGGYSHWDGIVFETYMGHSGCSHVRNAFRPRLIVLLTEPAGTDVIGWGEKVNCVQIKVVASGIVPYHQESNW